MSAPDTEFHDQADPGVEAPQSGDTMQDDYKSRTGQKQAGIPVQSDSAAIEDGLGSREQQNSDEQLMKDEADAIDESNIVSGRTRGAKPTQTYREPGDEEGLGDSTDGRSRVAGGPN